MIQEFEEMKGVPICGIDTSTFKGKHQRGELLVLKHEKEKDRVLEEMPSKFAHLHAPTPLFDPSFFKRR